MGRRSDFTRRPHDSYQTVDPKAVDSLMPFLKRDGITSFAEPCLGDGKLADRLVSHGLACVLGSDITGGVDALGLTSFNGANAIITNPPWTREILHPMIEHFQRHHPTWLLFDCDWAYNVHAAPYLDHCSDMIAVGRLKWFNNTAGKDNACWYRFDINHHGGPRFHGRNRMNIMNNIKPGELVGEYIQLRDAKKQFEEMASAKCRELYTDRMDAIEASLLDMFNTLGVDQISGKNHTAFRTTSVSVTTADGGAFREYIINKQAWELTDWKPNKTQMNLLAEAGEALPPGVNRTTFAAVQIRRKS